MRIMNNLIKQEMKLTRINLLSILLLEGFITISLEILFIRQLIPFVGNSVVVTSLIIGVFLLFLALGYHQGGREKLAPLQRLEKNFIIGSLVVGIGLSLSFCQVYFYVLARQASILFSLALYLLLVLAPTVFFLGQTIPLTTHFFRQATVSEVSSGALFLSTLGSFLGAVLTSLILLNYFGVAITIIINVGLMMMLALLIALKRNELSWIKLIGLAVSLLLIFKLNINYEHQFYIKTNNYGNYQVNNSVYKNRLGKIMWVNDAPMSFVDSRNRSFDYIEVVKKLLFKDLGLRNKAVLVVGAGGFTLSAESTFNNHFDYVDIDSQIKKVVEKNFLHGVINGHFIAEDARVYLNKSRRNYDVIFSDAYKSQGNIPPSLLTKEYFEQVDAHLKVNGWAIFNIIASPFFSNAYSRRVDNTIRAVFSHCLVVPVSLEKQANVIYLCHKQFIDDKKIYVDNLNSATLDSFKL